MGELNAVTGSENISQSAAAPATSFLAQVPAGPTFNFIPMTTKKVKRTQKKYDHDELSALTQSVG